MPKAIKKRINKKTGLDDSDVKTQAAHAWEHVNSLIKEKKKETAIALSATGLIIVISVAFLAYNSSMENKARLIEKDANIIEYSDQPGTSGENDLKKALALYQDSVNTKTTPTALYSLGNAHFKLGDYESAIKEYTRFTNEYRNEDELLPLVYQKLASAYSRAGKTTEAVEALHKLSALNKGIFKDTALVLEARQYAAAGKSEMAITKYKELAVTFPTSTWNQEAVAKIAADKKPEEVVTEEKAAE